MVVGLRMHVLAQRWKLPGHDAQTDLTRNRDIMEFRHVPLGYTKGGIGAHGLTESEAVDAGERCGSVCRWSVKAGKGIRGGGAVMVEGGALGLGEQTQKRQTSDVPCRGGDCVHGADGMCQESRWGGGVL